MLKKILTATTAVSIALSSLPAHADSPSIYDWKHALENNAAKNGKTGYTKGKHTNAVFKQFSGKQGWLFGNILDDETPLPLVQDITKVIEATKREAKPIIVASNDWILPSNPVFCEVADQVRMECGNFTVELLRRTSELTENEFQVAMEEQTAQFQKIAEMLNMPVERAVTVYLNDPEAIKEAYNSGYIAGQISQAGIIEAKQKEIDDLAKERDDLKTEVNNLKGQLQNAIDNAAQIQSQLDTANNQLTEKQNEINGLVKERNALQDALGSYSTSSEAYEAGYNAGAEAIRVMKDEAIANLNDKIEELYEQINGKNDTILSLHGQIDELEKEKASLQTVLDLRTEQRDAYLELATARAAVIMDMEEDLVANYTHNDMVAATIESWQSQVDDLNGAITALNETIDSKQAYIEELGATAAQLKADYDTLNHNYNNLSNLYDGVVAERDQLIEDLAATKSANLATIAELEADVELLQAALNYTRIGASVTIAGSNGQEIYDQGFTDGVNSVSFTYTDGAGVTWGVSHDDHVQGLVDAYYNVDATGYSTEFANPNGVADYIFDSEGSYKIHLSNAQSIYIDVDLPVSAFEAWAAENNYEDISGAYAMPMNPIVVGLFQTLNPDWESVVILADSTGIEAALQTAFNNGHDYARYQAFMTPSTTDAPGDQFTYDEADLVDGTFYLNDDTTIEGLYSSLTNSVDLRKLVTESYNTGYNDGYADGFADGVKSVKDNIVNN